MIMARMKMRLPVAVGAAGLLLLSACSSSSGHSVPGPIAASTALPAAPKAGGSGCGTSSPAGSTTLALTVDGHRRTVIVHVPTGYTGSHAVALVLNMHGSGSTAAQQEVLTGMDVTADTKGFIVAYPQALIPQGEGFDWNVPGVPLLGGRTVPSNAANDIAFLTQLVSVLEQHYCLNPLRVYATGFSGGARAASQLACDAAGTFAAVAPVSGLRRPTPCPATRPVPIVAFHGTADPVDPYLGHGQPYWTYSVPMAATYWSQQQNCPSRTTQLGSRFTLTRYTGCSAGSEIELYSILGEGHEWPGGPHLPRALTRALGPQSNAVNANAVMWAFFTAHPRAA